MKKILFVIVAVLVAIVGVFLVVVALQPNDYRIERSATINAPPAEVFAHVNDFQKWQEWSPWAELDPNAKTEFEGPATGKGAIFKWKGDDKTVGQGQMTNTESKAPELIRIQLNFLSPYEGTSNAEFTFKPDGKQTNVTWTMTGQRDFAGKAFCLVMRMDNELKNMFDKGLANMRVEVENTKK